MTHTCSRCGRVGTRGFWVAISMHPKPNRILCNNGRACDARMGIRRHTAAVAASEVPSVPYANGAGE